MASSFRIRLKMPTRAEADEAAEAQSNASAHPASSPRVGYNSSVLDDGSSMMSGEDGAEESDELEDSPPPQLPPKQGKGSPAGRKLSGAAAMKAANNLRRAKLAAAGELDEGDAASTDGRSSKRLRTASSSAAVSPSHTRTSTTPPALAAARAAAIETYGLESSAKRRSLLAEFGKPIEEMSLSEIEALPAAKRRKGLKARGASGPGRGWRKGLKMDQKPVYRQPGDSPPTAVAPETPSSFSRPKSALARDALSKASTPLRSQSPTSRESSHVDEHAHAEGPQSALPSRTLSASNAAAAARRARAKAEEVGSTSLTRTSAPLPAPPTAAAPVAAQAKVSAPTKEDEGRAIKAIIRGGPAVLAIPKIPIGFVTVTPLDRSGNGHPVRKWQRRAREILSLGGRPWSAVSWITGEQSQFITAATSGTEMKGTTSNPGAANASSAIETDRAAMGGHQSVMTGAGSALTTAPASGNVTPALASGALTPVAGNGPKSAASYLAEATARSTNARAPSINTPAAASSPQASVSRAKQPAPSAPSPSASSSSALTAADWKGSSAAFAAANRGRS